MGAREQEGAPHRWSRVYRVSLIALSLASQPPAAKSSPVPDLKPEASVAKEASEKASEPAEAPIPYRFESHSQEFKVGSVEADPSVSSIEP